MFNLDDFLARCHDDLEESNPMMAIRETVHRTVHDGLDLERHFGPYRRGGSQVLHNSDSLTVLHIVWPPGISIFPHDHQTWAVIGIHAGIEDNTFYRRSENGLHNMGTVRLAPHESRALPVDAIHAVANPESTPTAAIHVYGGDFLRIPRSEFDADTYEERPYDAKHAASVFERANEAWMNTR